ncbi:MAG: hypothetical protein US65_C0010G0010 [Candidatus Yanofskybacteria bacterium GW2011_GWC2_37_9]|uniref:Fimbrial assembly family protein n=1 Tax=Candidatus Yanofskybacteria bacterium GW2011_GWC2_37_9 TaxID=1619028 RepID=A0A0G0HYR3_9BACT|nr:MAG: hypothetical protein US65_C0010G0010 [Candidatus Yanofskybacteria bacterium GW2011_GWC2_37_9]
MDSNFQTSFIPKKPIVEKRATSTHSIGFFTVISIFILFTVLLASLALFFYKTVLTKNIAQMEKDLNLAKNRFEPSKIKELQVLDKRINSSNEILAHHIAVTPIFQALQLLTMKTVRYTKFDYSLEDGKDPKIIVKMSGQALGYSSIALQSDLFAKNKNLIDPVFSNLSLDDKGNILFDLEFLVDPSFVDYKQTLLAQS